jgi:hypothetical protein
MNRARCILMTLVAAALTLPVEAARPNSPGSRSKSAGRMQSSSRVTAAGPARSAGVQRRPTAVAARPGRTIARPQATADRRTGGSGERRSNGGPRQTARLEPRVPAPNSLTGVDAVLPNGRQPGTRIATPDRPDLPLPPHTVVDVGNPFGNGGGGNGGGGNGGGGNGGGGHRPPPGRHPGHYGRGPTGWDLLAIGLATAAFSDRGVVSGGGYVNDCVSIGQPSCGVATTLVGPEPVVIENDLEASALVADPAAAFDDLPVNDAAAPAVAEPLPQLQVGEPFTLPAAGLGSEQGRVAVKIGAVILECPVTAWTEAGLAATLPTMAVAGPAKADLLVALADGTLAAAVPVELLPAQGAAVAAAN